ncbi:MAG: PGF-pre-PGF domain-containing protein [Candidatus Methanoperedens sp.]|nr:PGF-pre-PGF domain-containing protein [Candidatus Methanoperedens sp.]
MNGWKLVLIVAALIILASGIYNDNIPDNPDRQGDGCKGTGSDSICNPASSLPVSLSEYIPVMKDPKPTKTPKNKKTPKPTDTPEPTTTPETTVTPEPKKTLTPVPATPEPTQWITPTPVPTSLAKPTPTPALIKTPAPALTQTIVPAKTPQPTKTPQVTNIPEPTATALANPAVTPVVTLAFTPTPEPTDTPVPAQVSTPAPSPEVSTGLTVYPGSQAVNSTVDINYNVSGAGNISFLITYPNGTVAELLNTSISTASFFDTVQFKIPQFGEYTAKIIASSPAGNTSSNSTIFYGMEVITTSTKIPAGSEIPLIIHKDMVLEAAANDTADGNVKLTAKIAPSNICVGAGAIAPVKAIKYIMIDTAAADHISNVTLKINYSSGDISGLDESTLSLYYWDNASNAWYRIRDYTGKEIPGGLYVYDAGVDTAVKYVWAKLDHFGVFALGGTSPGAGSTGIPSGTSSPSGGEESSPSSGGGGSSSSGGGGGGTSGEDYKNIEKIEKYEKTLYRDISTSYQFSQNGVVDSVNITGNVNMDSVNVIVEVLRDISSFADAQAPGLVYRNVNIWVGTSGFATPRNIKEATITFRVNRTWLDSNNISDVVLYRYTDGEWVALPTMNPHKKEVTGDYAVYRATTDHFSPFAVAGVKEDASAQSTRQSSAQKQSQKSAATAKATSTKKAQSRSEDWGAAMTVALVGIVAAALVFIRKKMM